MTTAEREIVELDKSLAVDGEWIWLRRVIGSSISTQQFIDVKCRAFVRHYVAKALTGGITQQGSDVILSPTQINRAQWPGGQVPGSTVDPRVPSKNRGDKIRIKGAWVAVESGTGITIGDTLVRIETRVLG
jgi:hypothetical protein